jgi:hypothetical protein
MKYTTVIVIFYMMFFFGVREVVAGEKISITIPSQSISESERIISFKASITSGWLVSLPKIPKAWSIYIENDPVWKTVVNGHVSIGTGAEYVNFFEGFMIIEKIDPERIPFNIELEIVTTTDFEKERHIVLKMKDLKLGKVTK